MEALFNTCFVEGDLDYPLIDGLLLYQKLDQQGGDLVLYYLKRFALENQWLYNMDLFQELMQEVEIQKGVSLELLSINFFEIVLYQSIAAYLCGKRDELILMQEDVAILKKRLLQEHWEKTILRAIEAVCDEPNILKYVLHYQYQILTRFEDWLKKDVELLVVRTAHGSTKRKLSLVLQNCDDFMLHLETLLSMQNVEEKMEYIQTNQLSLLDILDLFENQLFDAQEYPIYYHRLSLEEIAILIKLIHPEMNAFHQVRKLEDALFQEWNQDQEWVSAFITYLKSLKSEDKKQVEMLLPNIEIHIG